MVMADMVKEEGWGGDENLATEVLIRSGFGSPSPKAKHCCPLCKL